MFSFELLFGIRKTLVSFCCLILSISIWTSASGEEFLLDEGDRDVAELFLKHMLIEEQGIYTLMGTKPMTSFPFVPILDDSEKQILYTSQTDQFRKYIPFQKFHPTKEDVRKFWNDWKKIESKYLGKPYLIREDDKFGGLFINVLNVIYILETHLEEFEKVGREKIDPHRFIYTIGDSKNTVWEKIRRNHYLMGLLLGYGEKNSRYFAWETKQGVHYPQRHSTAFSPLGSGKSARLLTIHDLDMPSFVTYQIIDEQVERYKFERRKCIEYFDGKDFCELAVKILKGQAPKPSTKELDEKAMNRIRESCGYNSS